MSIIIKGGNIRIGPYPYFPYVEIGSQKWQSVNLDVSTYRNGDPIPEITNGNTWKNLTTGAWCYPDNDPALGAIYGKLYNWYAVNDPRGLAPWGWHIPTITEWNTLINLLNFFGYIAGPGGLLKQTGTSLWKSPNTGASNIFGFTALPAGIRGVGLISYFAGRTEDSYFWTSTEQNTNESVATRQAYFTDLSYTGYLDKRVGASVRFIKG